MPPRIVILVILAHRSDSKGSETFVLYYKAQKSVKKSQQWDDNEVFFSFPALHRLFKVSNQEPRTKTIGSRIAERETKGNGMDKEVDITRQLNARFYMSCAFSGDDQHRCKKCL